RTASVCASSQLYLSPTTSGAEIYTLSLHDALPISMYVDQCDPTALKLVQKNDPRVTKVGALIRKTSLDELPMRAPTLVTRGSFLDRKSTRLNSSHLVISYAVFCLKKKIIT